MINAHRLAETFRMLVETDSISKEEAELSGKLRDIFIGLGGHAFSDDAHVKIGGSTGNLIVKFKGTRKVDSLLLNAHMDTVEPGRGVRVNVENGVFTSAGDTILGADDKSAIAILIEVMRVLTENRLDHGPLELVFTVCEEIGLLGAKNLDFSLLDARFGYALDASDTEGVVTRAPGAIGLTITVHGKDAHAGAAPEAGINAISLASKAIAGLQLGRIDEETTCNIGIIHGGTATNIVPSRVTVKGEVRSHVPDMLEKITKNMVSAFRHAADAHPFKDHEEGLPRIDVSIEPEFYPTHIPDDHTVVELAKRAANNLGRTMKTKTTGGGADANVFFKKGIFVGVLGTGMVDMHTVRESIRLEEMVKSAELLLEIIRIHSENAN